MWQKRFAFQAQAGQRVPQMDDMEVDARLSSALLINKKAILRMAFFCLRTLLVSGWDGALTFLYGVAIAIKRVPGENGLA
ncbi:hypothetical protein SAMN05216315_12422 [Nitrosospira sp. Nsp18]|nr:hypothetical protein SAMN05216315_12422 [Nitrosospira sp. Nsp18]